MKQRSHCWTVCNNTLIVKLWAVRAKLSRPDDVRAAPQRRGREGEEWPHRPRTHIAEIPRPHPRYAISGGPRPVNQPTIWYSEVSQPSGARWYVVAVLIGATTPSTVRLLTRVIRTCSSMLLANSSAVLLGSVMRRLLAREWCGIFTDQEI